MTKEYWVEAALTNDALVAELLLRLKHSSTTDSLRAPPPPTTATSTTKLFVSPGWGYRKGRSKSAASTATVAKGFGKEQRGSPTTHLSWSCGGGVSTSDCYEESSRPSDLSSGGRSIKANEGASTSSSSKSIKRKFDAEVKEEEGLLLKERISKQELVSLNRQMATSEDVKRTKVGLDENPREGGSSCRVEAEKKGFVVPDLNMEPSEEDLATMS